MRPGTDKPMIDIDGGAGAPTVNVAPLSPELRREIHNRVTGDIYRVGMGAALILLFIPLFILTIISKFFIAPSRAAQNMPDLRRREAKDPRLTPQVTHP